MLDSIISSAQGDERPHLDISIFCLRMLRLLDYHYREEGMENFGALLLISKKNTSCKVANGQDCESIDNVSLPISLEA